MSLRITSLIGYLGEPSQRVRDLDQIERILIHRTGVDFRTGVICGYSGSEIASVYLGNRPEFANLGRATDWQLPYHFIVGGKFAGRRFDGVVWQLLPLNEIGAHALSVSDQSIGIALIGDFRGQGDRPSIRQEAMTLSLLSYLCVALQLQADEIHGHGEIAVAHDGSKAPGRHCACPGRLLDLVDLRAAVKAQVKSIKQDFAGENMRSRAEDYLCDVGVRFCR